MKAGSPQNRHTGPLPLAIGVTGHRDLRPDDIPHLENTVRNLLVSIQKKHPHTSLTLLSPLAEGADRLAAKVAVSLGIDLVVPLPMPRTEYEKDFGTASSVHEFNNLLGQARSHIILPWISPQTPDHPNPASSRRDLQYAAAGAFVAYYSQILIALWDGTQTSLTGGTAQVIDFMEHGIPAPYAQTLDLHLTPPDTGIVCHIWTPRLKNPQTDKPMFSLEIRLPEGIAPESGQGYFENIHRQMDEFNEQACLIGKRFPERIEQSRNNLFPRGVSLPAMSSSQITRQIDAYAHADALAQKYRSGYHAVILLLITIIVSSILLLDYHASHPSWPWISLHFAAIMFAWGLFRFSKYHAQHENKYLDYRALAEALRVQISWRLSGITDSIVPYYLPQHRSELDWIRNAMRSWTLPCTPVAEDVGSCVPAISPDAIKFSLAGWVKTQSDFFRTKAASKDHRVRCLTWISSGLFYASVAAAGVATVASILHQGVGVSIPSFMGFGEYCISGISLLLALAAAIEGYQRMLALREESRQYRTMDDLFSRSCKRIQKEIDQNHYGKALQTILELGQNALRENGDWVLMHRDRMELPKG